MSGFLYLLLMRKVLTIFILATLWSCNSEAPSENKEGENVQFLDSWSNDNIVVAHLNSEPDALHPYNWSTGNAEYIMEYLHKTIVRLDPETAEVIPELAASLPEVSEDGLTFKYELKSDVKWDDGSPLRVEDVVFSLKVFLCPLTNNPGTRVWVGEIIKDIQPDPENENGFIVEMKKAYPASKEIMGKVFILQKSFEDPQSLTNQLNIADYNSEFNTSEELHQWFDQFNDLNRFRLKENQNGLGPYKLEAWNSENDITIIRKDNWWADDREELIFQNNPNKIIYRIIADEAAQTVSLNNQSIDVANNLGADQLIELQDKDEFNQNYFSDFLSVVGSTYLSFNCKPDKQKRKPYFVDKEVRVALSHLVPSDELIEIILMGKGQRQVSFASPLREYYNSELALRNFDVNKAKELLDQAGWKDTDGDNIRDKVVDGQKMQLSFDLLYPKAGSFEDIAIIISEEMYKAGVKANLTSKDFDTWVPSILSRDFDATLGSWSGSLGYDDPMEMWHTSSFINGGINYVGFGNSESDSLIESINSTLDDAKRGELFKKLQEQVYDESPYVYIYNVTRKVAVHNRFDNIHVYSQKPGVHLGALKLKSKD